jgi:predicted ArsR family transcriptional regulator
MTTRDLASVSSLEDPVRHRLYEIVSARLEPVGRDEAAAAAGIGRPLAAYHLDKLVESGLLTVTYQRLGERSGPGAGRPAKLYAKSDREFAVSVPPRDYELAAQILVEAVAEDRDGSSRAALQHAARQLGTEMAGHGEAGDARELPRILSAHGYAPAVQDPGGGTGCGTGCGTGDGTVIRLRNCPFHHLAQRHRELVCGMNLSLIGGLVDGLRLPGWQPVLDPQPGHCCVAVEQHQPSTEEPNS